VITQMDDRMGNGWRYRAPEVMAARRRSQVSRYSYRVDARRVWVSRKAVRHAVR